MVAELPGELGVLQKAIRLVREGAKLSDAAESAPSLADPVARTLLEWLRLRHAESRERFERYDAFIRANPGWPSVTLRRVAEIRLWQEHRDGATIRRFIAGDPMTSKGRLAVARALISDGDRVEGERQIRGVWRADGLSAETENAIIDTYGSILTRADHLARMDRRIGAKEFGAATRAAKRVGDDKVAIVKACASSEKNAGDARELLDAVPDDARGDLGYVLCRIHYLIKHDELDAAARLVLAADPDALQAQDTPTSVVARPARGRSPASCSIRATPSAPTSISRAMQPSRPSRPTAPISQMPRRWSALRFLSDPATALAHFSNIDTASLEPITLARGA